MSYKGLERLFATGVISIALLAFYGALQLVLWLLGVPFNFSLISFGDSMLTAVISTMLLFSTMAIFWPVMFVALVVVSVFYADDWLWAGVFFFVVPAVLVYLLLNGVVVPSPFTSLLFVGGYLATGLVWSYIKWLLKASTIKGAIEKSIAGYVVPYTPQGGVSETWGTLTDAKKGGYIYDQVVRDGGLSYSDQAMVERDDFKKLDFAPKLKNNKTRLTRWVLYWPLSFLNYLFGKFLRDLVEAILNKLGKVYDASARWMIGEIKV